MTVPSSTYNTTTTAGRSALAVVGAARASLKPQVEPVDPQEALKDPSSSEYRELEQLKQRDREVRQHEQAHVAAGGSYVSGGPTYTFETGPDGKRYAIGGEVSIDTSAVAGDPAATIRKMQVVRSAALAPAEPSAQDRSVAAEASRAEAQARIELREQEQTEKDDSQSPRAQAALASYNDVAATPSTAGSAQIDLNA